MKPSVGERVVQLLLALLKALCYLTLFLGAQVLVMLPVIVASVFQMMMGGGVNEELLYQQLMDSSMVFSLVANMLTLFIVMAFYLIRRKRFSEALWLRRVEAPTLWAGASLAPALYLAVSLVLLALPESWMESYNEASSGITSGGMVGMLAIVVAAPIVEEVIFRGLIMTRLSQAVPGWLAVVLSALVFGACHGDLVWFGYAFPLGLLFGFIDLRAGSICPSILAHMVFNAIGQAADVLPDSDGAVLGFFLVLVALSAVLPILDRKGIKALFRRKPRTEPRQVLPTLPGVYEFDPWEA